MSAARPRMIRRRAARNRRGEDHRAHPAPLCRHSLRRRRAPQPPARGQLEKVLGQADHLVEPLELAGGESLSALPFRDAHRIEPFQALETRNRRLANVVEAISRRRDVRDRRAMILLLLLELRCPLGGRPRERWYTPGAVARFGADGIRSAWEGFYGEAPPTERTIRAHLGALEQSLAIIRAPGDWLWTLRDPEAPHVRPRHRDTIHVIENEAGAEWWATRGRELLESNPDTRNNPDRWRMVFGTWRKQSAAGPGELFPATAAPLAPIAPAAEEPTSYSVPARQAAETIGAAAARGADPFELLSILSRCGARVLEGNSFRLASDPTRLRGAAALLAIALLREAEHPDDQFRRVRKRAAWLVRAFRRADGRELAGALENFRPQGIR